MSNGPIHTDAVNQIMEILNPLLASIPPEPDDHWSDKHLEWVTVKGDAGTGGFRGRW